MLARMFLVPVSLGQLSEGFAGSVGERGKDLCLSSLDSDALEERTVLVCEN